MPNNDCPKFDEKYNKMGVTPHELFLRQEQKCWLLLAFDTYDEKEVPGELYCTDGNELAPTKDLLNPTFECMNCLSSFILNGEATKMSYSLKVNKVIVNMLTAIGKATEHSEDKPLILINKGTLDKLEEFLTSTTLAHTGQEALRFESGSLILFGIPIDIDDTVKDDTLKVSPADIEVELNI